MVELQDGWLVGRHDESWSMAEASAILCAVPGRYRFVR
jgi:hypothetical protein